MSDTQPPNCKACGEPVTLERGITAVGDLNAPGMDYYCEPCAPNSGRGYTLADLQRMREDGQVERAKYEMSMMELVGPDVYFAVKGHAPKLSPFHRLEEMKRRIRQTLRDIGVGE